MNISGYRLHRPKILRLYYCTTKHFSNQSCCIYHYVRGKMFFNDQLEFSIMLLILISNDKMSFTNDIGVQDAIYKWENPLKFSYLWRDKSACAVIFKQTFNDFEWKLTSNLKFEVDFHSKSLKICLENVGNSRYKSKWWRHRIDMGPEFGGSTPTDVIARQWQAYSWLQ